MPVSGVAQQVAVDLVATDVPPGENLVLDLLDVKQPYFLTYPPTPLPVNRGGESGCLLYLVKPKLVRRQ